MSDRLRRIFNYVAFFFHFNISTYYEIVNGHYITFSAMQLAASGREQQKIFVENVNLPAVKPCQIQTFIYCFSIIPLPVFRGWGDN